MYIVKRTVVQSSIYSVYTVKRIHYLRLRPAYASLYNVSSNPRIFWTPPARRGSTEPASGPGEHPSATLSNQSINQ